MPLPYPKDRGYSLIELLTVLAIVGILATVGVVTMGSRKKAAVRELIQQMTATLADAQQLARSTGRPVTLHVTGATPKALSIAFEYTTTDPKDATKEITVTNSGFSMAAQGNSAAYAVPGIGQAQVAATKVDTASLKALELVSDWDSFLVDGNAVFQGKELSSLFFANNGQLNRDCYITVSAPSAGPSSPVGIVIATRRNGIHAYLFSGEAGATWRSL